MGWSCHQLVLEDCRWGKFKGKDWEFTLDKVGFEIFI